MDSPFTAQEEKIMELLILAHNTFLKLDNSQADEEEWITAIHLAQDVLGRKVLRRAYPKYFNK